MPRFYYVARDKTGSKVTGVEDANSQDDLVNRLQVREMVVINVVLSGEGSGSHRDFSGKKAKLRSRHWGINTADLCIFCRQLATLLGSGITIVKSLEVISQQVASTRLSHVIKKLSQDMEQGLSFHEAMAKHPQVFSEIWVNLVESGEASGNLAMVLERLAKYLERNEEFKRKIVSALIYPIILFSAGMGALLFLTIKIIPTFADLFKGFNIELPALTQMLINVSAFLRKYFLLVVGISVAAFYLFKGYIKTKEGRLMFDNMKLNAPIFGDFFRALTVERFSSEMSTLVESGVPILYALEISEHSVGNAVMENIVKRIKEDVRQGKPLSKPMEESLFFEPMVVQMLTIGEEIGELSQMFKRINVFYQEYVETFLTRFASLFEPLVLVFMGFVIGIMVVGMFLPIFKIAQIGGSG